MNETVVYKGHRTIVMSAPQQFVWRYQVDDGAIHPCFDRPLSSEDTARDEALGEAMWRLDQIPR